MVEQQDLDRVVDSLKDHINDKFKAFQRYDEEVHSNIRATLALHSHDLYNSDNGVVRQVNRIETTLKTARKMTIGFFALVSSTLAYLGLK